MRARDIHAVITLAAMLAAPTFLATRDARAAGVDPRSATPTQTNQAGARFAAGNDLFKQGKFDDALKELRASFDIVASPNTHLLIADCLRGENKLVEAYVQYGQVEAEGKELGDADYRYKEAATTAGDDREEIEKEIGLVSVTVANATSDTTLSVGGETITRAGWGQPAPVMPGTTTVEVQTPGHKPASKTFTIGKGEKQSISIDAATDPLPTATPSPASSTSTASASIDTSSGDKSKLRPYAYVAGAVGAAGLLTFTIAGLMANSTYSGLKDACPNGTCPQSKGDDISSGKTQQTIANVGLVIGALGIATGAVLFVISAPKKDSAPAASASLVVGPGWLGVKGSL
jgi:hypothetical protein